MNVLQQIISLMKNPIEGIKVVPDPKNFGCFFCTLTGPEGTPYAGGSFKLLLELADEIPFFRFLTPVYHPNVSDTGLICLNILQKDWNPKIPISTLLVSIQALLANPNPEDPFEVEIGELWMKHPSTSEKIAKEWTNMYATEKKQSQDFLNETDSS